MNRHFPLTVLLILVFLFTGLYAEEKPIALETCVEIALEQNPDLLRSEFQVKIAGKDVTLAFANFLPQVSSELSYIHTVIGPSSVTRIDPQYGIQVPIQPNEEVNWNSNVRVTASQPLFTGGYNVFNYLQKRSLKKSAEYSFEDTRQTTIYVVKERYYNLLAAEKLLEVARETAKSSEESFKRAEVLFAVGTVPKSDVLKAKVQLETDRLGLIEAQNNLAIARASLNHILGYDVDHDIQIVDNLEVPEIEVGYDDAMLNAMSDHPALLKSTCDVRASRANIGMAASQYLPSVTALYSYNWQHQKLNEIKNIFDRDYNWYLGVSLRYPIFQGFSRVANLSKAQLDYKSNQEALEQVKRDVALAVQTAYFQMEQAKKQILVSQNAVDAADEDLRLNKEKYNLGSGTILDLIDAQVSYTSAKSDHIQALYNYKKAIAKLQQAMGKLNK